MPIIEGAYLRPGAVSPGTPAAGYGPFTSPGVPAAGYLNGTAEKGALVVNTATGVWYANNGTKDATTWQVVGVQV